MNMMEKQTELGKSLYTINTATLSEIAELSRKNIEQYFEVNRSFGEKLPEVRELGSFMSLQREYGETMWNQAREAMEAQSSIIQNAFSETREAVQTAFKSEESAPKQVVAKATRATKAAKAAA